MTGRPGDASTSISAATTEYDGRPCWFADPDIDNNFLYFAVDDSRVPENANTAWVTLEYFDSGTGDFTIHYDGESSSFTRADTVELQGDGTWKTHRLRLDDIRFDGRANGHDFRISTWDQRFGISPTPVCVGHVRVAFDYRPPDLEISSTAIGNVFVQPQVPTIDVETRGDTVQWQVHDFWGERVAHGRERIGERGTLTLAGLVSEAGYYQLEVSAELGDRHLASTTTDLAVVSPFDVAAVTDSPFGTVPHSTREDNLDKLALAATMGAKNVREAALWFSVEPEQRGEYVFDRYDPLVSTLATHGMRWLPVASYINDLYDDGATPYTDEGRSGYADYIGTVADRYRDDVEWIEIYNEFNIKRFGARGGSPANSQADYYFPLLKEAYQEIKQANPNVTVVGGATSSVPLDWLEELFALGGLKYVDAISVHPYVFPSNPEDSAVLLSKLRELVDEYDDAGEPTPIWITEQGYPTHENAKGVSEATQAENVVRSHVVAFAEGVEKFFWYNLMNQGTSDTAVENNYGLIRNAADDRGSYVPKPGYVSYATMARELTGAQYQREESIDGVTSHVFSADDHDIRVIWANSPTTVAVRTGRPITVTDLMGRTTKYQPHAGRVHLTASSAPLYVHGTNIELAVTDKFTLTSVSGENAIIGDPIELTLEVDNTMTPRAPMTGTFDIGPEVVDVSVRPGERAEIPITLPASSEAGVRALHGELSLHGRLAARFAVDVQVTHPVEVSSHHVLNGMADALSVDVTNVADRQVAVGELTWSVAGKSGRVRLPEGLAPGSTHTTDISLADLPQGNHQSEIHLSVDGYDDVEVKGTVDIVDTSNIAEFGKRSIVVDGTLDDLSDVPAIDLASDGRLGGRWTTATDDEWIYGGVDDLSGTIWPTWDEENMYLSARITDDVHHQRNPAPTVWAGDGITFTLSAGMPSEERPFVYNEYRAALSEDGQVLYRALSGDDDVPVGRVRDAELEIRRDDAANETIYELAIPWQELAPMKPGHRLMSFSVQADDNDGLDRKGWIAWRLAPAILTTE